MNNEITEKPNPQDITRRIFINHKEEWLLFIGFALFNLIIALRCNAPGSYPDEYQVFSMGNWMFGGEPWGYKSVDYYGYTSAPFAGLMLSLFDDIRYIYAGTLSIFALQVSLVPVFCYKLLDEVLNMSDTKIKLLIATTISLYPAITIYSKRVCNETAMFYVLFICLYIIGKCAVREDDKKLTIYSVLLGFFAVFAYASHGMGLAYIVAICALIPVTHLITKKKLVNYFDFSISLLISWFLDSQIKAVMTAAVYKGRSTGLTNTFGYSFKNMVDSLFNLKGIGVFTDIFLSRLYYLSQATFVLFTLVCVILFFLIIRRLKAWFLEKEVFADAQDRAEFILTLFGFFIIICGITLSSMHNVIAVTIKHGTYYFYGRYYEYMALPLIIMGLYYIFCKGVEKKTLLIYSAIALAGYILLTAYVKIFVAPNILDGTTKSAAIIGILPFIGTPYSDKTGEVIRSISHFDMRLLFMSCVLVFITVMYIFIEKEKHRWLALVIISIMFLYTTIYYAGLIMWPIADGEYRAYTRMKNVTDEFDVFSDLYEEYPKLYLITNNLGGYAFRVNCRAQLAFHRYTLSGWMTIKQFNNSKNPKSKYKNSIIVSDKDHELEKRGTDKVYRKIHDSNGVYIWIRGDDIIKYYNESKLSRK